MKPRLTPPVMIIMALLLGIAAYVISYNLSLIFWQQRYAISQLELQLDHQEVDILAELSRQCALPYNSMLIGNVWYSCSRK